MEDQLQNIPKDCSGMCPVAHALEIIGGKWRLPIIWHIAIKKNVRYNELKRHLTGITNIMLTRSLQALEEHGLVIRTEFNKVPPHVEYSLTELCKELMPALKIINEWGKKLPTLNNKDNEKLIDSERIYMNNI